MRPNPLWLVLLMGMMLAVAHGGPPSPRAARRAPRPGLADEAVIGHIEMRNRRVTVRSTVGGLRYTVRDARGAVVHKDLTLDELQARAPRVGEVMRTGQAGPTERGVRVDASLRIERR